MYGMSLNSAELTKPNEKSGLCPWPLRGDQPASGMFCLIKSISAWSLWPLDSLRM